MNFVYISEQELRSASEACISSERRVELLSTHELARQPTFAVAIENQGLGQGRLLREAPELHIAFEVTEPPPRRAPCELVVSVPRPQTVKKLLHLSAAAGLKRITFVRSKNVVPSYLQSKSLLTAAIQREFRLACEQVGDCRFPEFRLFRDFDSWMAAAGTENPTTRRLFADKSGELNIEFSSGAECLLALGPELGWDLEEMSAMTRGGFQSVSLGPRMYRVEIAASLLLAPLLK